MSQISIDGTFKGKIRSNDSLFYFIPRHACENTDAKGRILCRGKIPLYETGTPLVLTGSWSTERENLFLVSKSDIPAGTKAAVVSLLLHVVNDKNHGGLVLSEKEAETISEAADNQIFSFIEIPDCEKEILCPLLKDNLNREQIAKKIVSQIGSMKQNQAIFEELSGCGISYETIHGLMNSELSISSIRKHPYQILMDYHASLRDADHYALWKCGYDIHSPERYQAFLRNAAEKSLSSGDTCCSPEDIWRRADFQLRHANRILNSSSFPEEGIPFSLAMACIPKLRKYLGFHEAGGVSRLYVNHVWDEETSAVHHTARLLLDQRETHCNPDVSAIEQALVIQYSEEQRKAFDLLRTTGIKILTGPPGSGKTALIRGLIYAFEKEGKGEVSLAATTGMAAKVMTSACGITDSDKVAHTVHILLGMRCMDNGTIVKKNLEDPVKTGLIIVDETSMMDLQLFSALVSAVQNGSILLLVGDDNQLESVGYGNILNDLIQSGLIPTCRLTKVFRQSGNSVCGTASLRGNSICENAQKINRGDTDVVQDESFQVVECSSGEEAREKLLAFHPGEHPEENLVLSPVSHLGSCSVEELNLALQKQNPRIEGKPFLTFGRKHYHVGDAVIFLRNDYGRGFINGDVGEITAIRGSEFTVLVGEDERLVHRSDLNNMDLAYALTIHKSQGSERDTVYVLLPEEAESMMTRRLLYTAVTRAKKKVVIFSVNGTFKTAAANTREKKRNTFLKERLVQEMNEK